MITVTLRQNSTYSSSDFDKSEYMIVNWRVNARPHLFRPPTDFYELEDRFIVRVEIPGMKEESFDISLDQKILLVHGIRPDISESRAYHQMEINYGEFATSVEIPGMINSNLVTAEYQNGFLLVILPKAKPTHIEINE